MLELILEILGEFLLQAVAEVLVEIGLHSLAEPFRRPQNPWLAAVGYSIFGAAIGALSLLAFSASLASYQWRVLNLLVTPVAVGGIMALIGVWRARRDEPIFRIDRFAYGYLFALSLALVRFRFAS